MRLRTDDLKGFRRYDRIKETLLHELAHMVYGSHDTDFKELNSQVWVWMGVDGWHQESVADWMALNRAAWCWPLCGGLSCHLKSPAPIAAAAPARVCCFGLAGISCRACTVRCVLPPN